MKNLCYLAISSILLSGCDPSALSNAGKESNYRPEDTIIRAENYQPVPEINPARLLTEAEASKIVGETTVLTDSSITKQDNTWKYQSTFTTNGEQRKDSTHLYFMFEQFGDVSSAINKFAFVRESNENNGIEDMSDMAGDEAYFHTDNDNFYFIIVRKGDNIFSMKVNKITKKTSKDELQKAARRIAKEL